MFPSLLSRRPRSSLRTLLALRQPTPFGHNLLDGLVEFWPLNEPASMRRGVFAGFHLDEIGSVGNADGIDQIAALFVSGNLPALSIDSQSALNVGTGNGMTIAAWVYLDAVGSSRAIVGKYDLSNQREWYLFYEHSSQRFGFNVSSNGQSGTVEDVRATTFGQPSLDTWYLVIGWYDRATNEIGISVNAGAANTAGFSSDIHNGNGPIVVGALPNGGLLQEHLDGRLQGVGFWRRALSSAERTYLYNSGRGRSFPFSSKLFNGAPALVGGRGYDWVGLWIKEAQANGGEFEVDDTGQADSIEVANGFVDQARTKSWFPRMVYVLAMLGGNLATALTPLIDRKGFGRPINENGNFVDADFDQAVGLRGNGTNKRLTLPFKPGELGVSNNGGVGWWELDSGAAGNANVLSAYNDGSTQSYGLFISGSGDFQARWGLSTTGIVSYGEGIKDAHYYGQRSSPTSRKAFKDGSLIATGTNNDSASGVNDNFMQAFGASYRAAPFPEFYWGGLCGIIYATDGRLTDAEAEDLHETIRDYLMIPTGKISP